MTSNLRRLSGAADLKIDITDPMNASNSKYCNKKIKVNTVTRHIYAVCNGYASAPQFIRLTCEWSMRARDDITNSLFCSFNLFRMTASQHPRHDGRGECDSATSRDPAAQCRRTKISIECGTWWCGRNAKVNLLILRRQLARLSLVCIFIRKFAMTQQSAPKRKEKENGGLNEIKKKWNIYGENEKENMIYRDPCTADTIFPSGTCNSFNDNDNKLSHLSPIFSSN